MFSLPSVWNLIISTIAFSVAAKYTHVRFHRRGIPEGKKRNLWVLGIASLLSWGEEMRQIGRMTNLQASNLQYKLQLRHPK